MRPPVYRVLHRLPEDHGAQRAYCGELGSANIRTWWRWACAYRERNGLAGVEADAVKASADSCGSQRPREQAGRRSALAFLQERPEAFRKKIRDSLNLMAAVQFPPQKPAGLPTYNRTLGQEKFAASQERCGMCRGPFTPAGPVTAKLLTQVRQRWKHWPAG